MRLDYQPLDIIYLLHASSRHISLRPLDPFYNNPGIFLNRIRCYPDSCGIRTYSKQGLGLAGKKNNRDGDITMPLSLKTIRDSAG